MPPRDRGLLFTAHSLRVEAIDKQKNALRDAISGGDAVSAIDAQMEIFNIEQAFDRIEQTIRRHFPDGV